MATTFNSQLQAGLNGTAVLYVDAYTQGRDQYTNPAKYGISNVTTPACSATSPANPLAGSSIACTAASTIPGDTSGYLAELNAGSMTKAQLAVMASDYMATNMASYATLMGVMQTGIDYV